MMNKRMHLLILTLLTLITYVNILQNGFAWDDRDFFLEWPQIKSEEGLPAYLSIPYLLSGDLPLNHRGVYRPLRSIYQLATNSIWGENPLGYHIQALVVHILIVLVIYLITEIITKKRVLAFIVAGLFATHPIHTEAVTYTAASMDTLGILFFFLSFYCYLKTENEKFKKGIYLFASLLYAFLAFFTYEMTLVLPFLIILYDFSANKFSPKKLLSKINIYKYFFLLLIVYMLIRFMIFQVGNRADYLGPIWQITANQARVGLPEIVKNYVSWLIWPTKLTVSHGIPTNLLYGYLHILGKIDPTGKLTALSTNIIFLFPIFYIMTAIFLIYIFLKKYPLVVFGFAWLIISLLPVSAIIPQGAVIAERFLYIPSFGFTLILGFLFFNGIHYLFKKRRHQFLSYTLIFGLFLTIAFYTYKTIERNKDWRDEKTIWQAAIKTDPTIPLPYGALAKVYLREGQYDTGINLIKKVIELNETNAQLNSDLGLAFEKNGEIEKAIKEQRKALKINPEYYPAHVYLGNIYLKQEKYDLAEKEYAAALKYKKDDPFILSYLGDTYYNQKKYEDALDLYIRAFNLNQDSDQLALNIGLAYLKLSKCEQATIAFNKTLELNPKNKQALLGLAACSKKNY